MKFLALFSKFNFLYYQATYKLKIKINIRKMLIIWLSLILNLAKSKANK